MYTVEISLAYSGLTIKMLDLNSHISITVSLFHQIKCLIVRNSAMGTDFSS